MEAISQGVYLDVPQTDMEFLRKLVRKMGWRMSLWKEKEAAGENIADRLYGIVRLPSDFDYKKEVEKVDP